MCDPNVNSRMMVHTRASFLFTHSSSLGSTTVEKNGKLQQDKKIKNDTLSYPHYAPVPADLHHRTCPSCPPVMNAPAVPGAGGFGDQATLHTSPLSWSVETAARADKSQTLIVLSADLVNKNY